MSIIAKIAIDDKIRNVLFCEYGFHQPADENGRPNGKPKFVGLTMVVEADRSNDLYEWSIQPNQTKQLLLQFTPALLGGKSRKLHFIDAHCLQYHLNQSAGGSNPGTERVFISAGGVKDADSSQEYSAYWRTTFASDDTEVLTREENTEPTAEEGYFTTLQGDRIPKDELQAGSEVYYVMKTKNAVGQYVDVDLADAENDFTYNGKVLPNDTLEDLKITSDTQRIKLTVIRQTR